jgi:hypothetical protein
VKSKPQQANGQKPVENKNNDVVKNSAPLPATNTAAKGTTTPAVANEKKETDLKAKENQLARQPVIDNSKTNDVQKTGKTDLATIDNKKEQTVATSNTNVNKPTQAPSLKNDVAANTGGVQSGNGNNSSVNRSSQTQTVEKKKPDVVQVSQKIDLPINDKTEEPKNISAVSNKPVSQQKEITVPAKQLPTVVADRKNETMQDIYFKNDSLILSLYDNGIVDGDTVSVFMNGENIISKQKLKESAIKQTIYVAANSDSLQLVLFAENLGTIPPNTGLLTVRDGDDVYQVRFSADLQKNASIILRRKK